MKETTKYNNYRFVGKINVDQVEPWFDFDKAKPWDDMEVPWLLENKVRREILIRLARGPKSFQELYESLNFSPRPLLISKDEYQTTIKYQWTKETLENHLLNLEWYDLIKKEEDKYVITIPILKKDKNEEIEQYISQIANNWIEVMKELKNDANKKFSDLSHEKAPLFSVLTEKAVELLYDKMKQEGLLPNIPNIRTLWAEQLRTIKFEEWVAKNF